MRYTCCDLILSGRSRNGIYWVCDGQCWLYNSLERFQLISIVRFRLSPNIFIIHAVLSQLLPLSFSRRSGANMKFTEFAYLFTIAERQRA